MADDLQHELPPFEVLFSRKSIEGLLKKKEGLPGLMEAAAETYNHRKSEIAGIINEEKLGHLNFPLLHQTLKRWLCLESIKHLISLGANPLTREVNGDTPLHVAVYVDASNEVIEALLHYRREGCIKAPTACDCGIQAIRICNRKRQYPKDIRAISTRVQQLLLTEEVIHAVRRGENLLDVYKLVEEKRSKDFTKDFPEKLLKTIIELEDENDKRYLMIAMMFHMFKEKDMTEGITTALKKIKWKTFFMLHSMKLMRDFSERDPNEGNSSEGNTSERDFLLKWSKKELILPPLPVTESWEIPDEEIKEKLKTFLSDRETVAYLIAVSVCFERSLENNITEILLKIYHAIHNTEEKEECPINWSGLSLKEIRVTDKIFSDISKAQSIELSDNQLTTLPPLYESVKGFHWTKHIKILKLHNNCIEAVNKEIFNMECLRELRLDGNQIRTLPNNIKFSQSLLSLNLSKNKLTSLPNSLAKSFVSSLNISFNIFESLPECVCELRNLQTLNLTGNKGILEFPSTLGRLGTNTDIICNEMEQLCYPPDIYRNSKVLINFLRMKLYKSDRNKSMNMMVVGPCKHGKTRLLDEILSRREDDTFERLSVQFCEPYTFQTKKFWLPRFELKPVDFPGSIEYSPNQCFLTKNSLYLVVWNVTKNVETLREWLNCLTTYAKGSFVMFIGTHADQYKVPAGILEQRNLTAATCNFTSRNYKDQLKKLKIELSKQDLIKLLMSNPHFVKHLNFGKLSKPVVRRKKRDGIFAPQQNNNNNNNSNNNNNVADQSGSQSVHPAPTTSTENGDVTPRELSVDNNDEARPSISRNNQGESPSNCDEAIPGPSHDNNEGESLNNCDESIPGPSHDSNDGIKKGELSYVHVEIQPGSSRNSSYGTRPKELPNDNGEVNPAVESPNSNNEESNEPVQTREDDNEEKPPKLGYFWFDLISVNESTDIKRLRDKIEAVACDVLSSVDGNVSNIKTSYRRRVLGDSYPKYYFHLLNIFEEKKRQGIKFLRRNDVLPPLKKRVNLAQKSECCPTKNEIKLEKRDLTEAVDFLISTGHILYFDNKHTELYFIDLKWFNENVLGKVSFNSVGGCLSIDQILANLDNSIPEQKLVKNDVVPLIKSFNIGFFVSDHEIQFAHLLPHYGDERLDLSCFQDSPQEMEKLCRLHVFRDNYIPFGLWVKLLSRLFWHLEKLLSDGTSAAYDSYQETLTRKRTADFLKGDRRYWRGGFVYEDKKNKTFFSVVKSEDKRVTWLNNIEDFKQAAIIKTEVVTGDPKRSAKILIMVVNHINTMLDEFFGLLGAYPKVFEYSPCVTCMLRKVSPPYVFTLDECFREYQQNEFSPCTEIPCMHGHGVASLVRVGKLFPELLYADCPQLILSPCHEVQFGKNSRNIGAGASGTVQSGTLQCHANPMKNHQGEGPHGNKNDVLQGNKNDVPQGNNMETHDPRNFGVAVKFQLDPYIGRAKFLAFKKESMLLLDASDHPYIITVYGVRLTLPYPEKDGPVSTHLSIKPSVRGAAAKKKENAPSDSIPPKPLKKGMALVMEHALEGSLSKKLKELRNKKLHLNRILLYRVAFQIADAIAYMHHLHIYHRDIKPGNILLLSSDIDSDTNVKVADFDTACFAGPRGQKFSGVGTVEYKGPEYYQGSGYQYESFVDIWAYGVVIFELLTLCVPFRGLHPHAIRDHVKNLETPLSLANPDVVVREDGLCIKQLMQQCWREDFEKRPKGKDLMFLLLNHCFQSLLYSFSCGRVRDIRHFAKFGDRSKKVAYIAHAADTEHLVLHKISFGKPHSKWKEETDLRLGIFEEEFQNVEDVLYLDIINPNSLLMLTTLRGSNDEVKFLQVKTGGNFANTVVPNFNREELTEMFRSVRALDTFRAQRVIKVQRNNDVVVVYFKDKAGNLRLRKYDQESQENRFQLKLRAKNWQMDGIQESTDFILTSNCPEGTAVASEPISFLVMSYKLSLCVFTLEIRSQTIVDSTVSIDLQNHPYEDGCQFLKPKGIIKALYTFQVGAQHYIIVTFTMEPRFVVIPWSVRLVTSGDDEKQHKDVQTSKALHESQINSTGCEVTAFCSIFDTLWFGYKNGRILVYTIVEEGGAGAVGDSIKRSMKLLRSMDPYSAVSAPVEMLLSVDCEESLDHDGPSVVLSYGKKLNENAFYKNNLAMCYPGEEGDEKLLFNRKFLEQAVETDRDCDSMTDAQDLILFWHAEQSERMERFEMKRSENSLRNENLGQLNNHSEGCQLYEI